MKTQVNQPCIVCDSSESQLLHVLRYPLLGYPGDFNVRECTDCKLIFNSPRLASAQIERLYDASYYVFRERERDAVRRVAQLASQTVGVAQQLGGAREVLEVGCAKGYLIALLQAWGWSVRGVEIAAEAAQFARQRFGVDVFTGTLEAWVASTSFKPTPMILSTDVIEHVSDPSAFLLSMHAAVAPGGWLILGTPNADSEHRQSLQAGWLGFNPFHIYLFTRDTLSRLLHKAGFEVMEAYTYTNGDAPAPQPRSGVRHAARTAAHVSGLLPMLRWARDRIRALADRPVSAQTLLEASRAGWSTYLTSDDGRSPRRTACRGDNLVVIARRPQ